MRFYGKRIYTIIAVLVVIISSISVVGVITTEKAMATIKLGEEYDFLMDIKHGAYNDVSSSDFIKKGGIVFLGDSITELCNVYDFYGDLGDVYNRGIVKDYTSRMLHRVEKNVNIMQPSQVVLLIGTNDIGRGIANEVIAENIGEIIDLLKTTPNVKIILQAVYPVNKSIGKAVGLRTNEKITQLNVLIKAVAEDKNCTFVDMTKLLVDSQGNLKREYTPDGLHLNRKGYLRVVPVIRNCLA